MSRPLYTLGCFRAGLTIARLSPRWLTHGLAGILGRYCYRKNRAERQGLRENLQIVTGASGQALEEICMRNAGNFAGMLADYFYCASRPREAASGLLEAWAGAEHLDAAVAAKKGVIIATGHLGHWELGGIVLALRGLPMTVVTLDEPTTALTEWRDAYRRKLGIKTIAVGPGREFAFVEMIHTLRRGECLAMLVDRPYGTTGAPVRFFGRETQFSTAPALLWQHTGAAVLPAFVVRTSRSRYTCFAEPPVAMQAGGDPRAAQVENTQALASAFESVIRRYPEQWFNYVPIWNSAPSAHDSSLP